jgi:hypothetical protein
MTGRARGLRCRKTGGPAQVPGFAGAVPGLPRRVAVAVAAATLAAAAAGCSSGNPVNTGPFGGANWNTGQICVPSVIPASR